MKTLWLYLGVISWCPKCGKRGYLSKSVAFPKEPSRKKVRKPFVIWLTVLHKKPKRETCYLGMIEE